MRIKIFGYDIAGNINRYGFCLTMLGRIQRQDWSGMYKGRTVYILGWTRKTRLICKSV